MLLLEVVMEVVVEVILVVVVQSSVPGRSLYWYLCPRSAALCSPLQGRYHPPYGSEQ